MGTWIKAPGIALVCMVLCAEPSWAGYTSPSPNPVAVEEISFQALLTDMVLPSISPNPQSYPAMLSYQGSFSQGMPGIQDGWAGSLSGSYLGSPVTGSISAKTVGDPDWVLSGQVTVPAGTFKLSGTLVEDANDATKYDLQNVQLKNNQRTIKWLSPDELKEDFRGNDDILSGKIKAIEGNQVITYDASIRVTLSQFKNGVWSGKMISTFKQIDPKVPAGQQNEFPDSGTVGFKQTGNGVGFLGNMSDQVSAVPEPATVALFGMRTLTLLGYSWRRRKRSA